MFSYKGTMLVIKSIAVVFSTVMLLFISCNNKKQLVTDAVLERDSMSVMTTYGVSTFISDSGIIRYKIIADEWMVFDKKNPPYWAFEKGIYVEKFDTLHAVEASIKADTAYYNTKDEIWTLKSNVVVASPKGESFKTELLYWNQRKEKVYSDRYIEIIQPDKTIAGYGFESNQQMTEYEIKNITGIFYVDDDKQDTIPSNSDTTNVEESEK